MLHGSSMSNNNITKIDGQLEIDHTRGVIYFHSFEDGHTVLRICRLPTPIPSDSDSDTFLDITYGYGVNWKGERQIT